MADRNTRRLQPKVLREDLDGFAALGDITDYTPANPAFSLANVTATRETMQALQEAEARANAAAAAARDAAAIGERNFHDAMLGVKAQVKAQYGDSSDHLQAVGLKKKSEYKNPTRRKPA